MIFFCGSVYFGQQVQKTMFIYFQSRSLVEPLRNPALREEDDDEMMVFKNKSAE
jgi:hypothetical protein